MGVCVCVWGGGACVGIVGVRVCVRACVAYVRVRTRVCMCACLASQQLGLRTVCVRVCVHKAHQKHVKIVVGPRGLWVPPVRTLCPALPR